MNTAGSVARARRLRALGIEPLRLRARSVAARGDAPAEAVTAATPTPAPRAAAPAIPIRRLALQPDAIALDDPAIRAMYSALTEAVGKAGLQRVRPADVAGDPAAAVIVFGAASAPAGVVESQVVRAASLTALQADRALKQRLWARMQALGRGEAG